METPEVATTDSTNPAEATEAETTETTEVAELTEEHATEGTPAPASPFIKAGTGFTGTFGMNYITFENPGIEGFAPKTQVHPFLWWVDPVSEDVFISPFIQYEDAEGLDLNDDVEVKEYFGYPTVAVYTAMEDYVVETLKAKGLTQFAFGKVSFLPGVTPDEVLDVFGFPFKGYWTPQEAKGGDTA